MAGADDADAPQLRPSLVTIAGPGRGFRHFLEGSSRQRADPASLQPFVGGQKKFFHGDGTINRDTRDHLHVLLSGVASRLAREEGDNANIPSGYAYLLQFIAHDMVDSAISWTVDGDTPKFTFTNARVNQLCLDTLYGAGPAGQPNAYAPSKLTNAHPDVIPRTRLRLGNPTERAAGDWLNLRTDIARGFDSNDLVAGGDGHSPDEWRTIPLIADARNDAHALISQLTALFHVFHNTVMDMIDPPNDDVTVRPRTEDVYRGFLCARTAVTMIYRAIIVNDVLPRLLHPLVRDLYIENGKPRLDRLKDDGTGLSIEFSHGAFRFAHAMTRGTYIVNSQNSSGSIKTAFAQTSARMGGVPLVRENWQVDWAYFFDVDLSQIHAATNGAQDRPPVRLPLNLSHLLRPQYPIDRYIQMDRKTVGLDVPGLANRDLLSACYARCWSVPHLIERMRQEEAWRDIVPPYDDALQRAVAEPVQTFPNESEIVADPPLPYFIQCEAKKSGSTHLGPVGSILIAEAVLGALKRNPIGPVEDTTLAERLNKTVQVMLPAEKQNALSKLTEEDIDSMPKLLIFLANQKVFAAT